LHQNKLDIFHSKGAKFRNTNMKLSDIDKSELSVQWRLWGRSGGRRCELDSSTPKSKDKRSSQEKSGSKTVIDFINHLKKETLHASPKGIKNSRGAVSKTKQKERNHSSLAELQNTEPLISISFNYLWYHCYLSRTEFCSNFLVSL